MLLPGRYFAQETLRSPELVPDGLVLSAQNLQDLQRFCSEAALLLIDPGCRTGLSPALQGSDNRVPSSHTPKSIDKRYLDFF